MTDVETLRRLVKKLRIRRIKPIQVRASDSVEDVVFETVRMYVGDDVSVNANLSFADSSVFDPDDPSDIVESLESS